MQEVTMKRNAILLAMFSIMALWLSGCITTHSPSDSAVTIKVGDSQTFTVQGVANGPYTWKKGGVVVGDTTGTYTYTALLADLGTFTVEVSTKDAFNVQAKFTWTVEVVNDLPPVANAGPDQNLFYPNPVTLDGSGSSDPEAEPLNYVWEIVGRPAGSSCALDNPNAEKPIFVPDKQGAYTIVLIVNDGRLTSAPDTVIINSYTDYGPPTANAGDDQSVVFGSIVTLDGSASTDPEDTPLTYKWKIDSGPAGSLATLDNPAKDKPKFTPDKKGVYVCSLVVNNGVYDSGIDLVVIIVYNNPPVAWAGADITVPVLGGSTTLDGSASADPDLTSLTYVWTIVSRPYGSLAALSNRYIMNPGFTPDKKGAYIMQLVVSDGDLTSSPDKVIITCSNQVPVANAGDAIIVPFLSTAQLNGSATDPDNDPMTYAWTITTRPLGSTAVLSNAAILNPTFTPDVQGSYEMSLVATDNTGLSSAPSTVMVSTGNHQPVADAGDDVIMSYNATEMLNGSGTDVDLDPLTYTWRVITAPMGSGGDTTLSDLEIANPVFTPDKKGDYVLGLVVNDGQINSAEDTMKIHVINNQPIAEAGPTQDVHYYNRFVTLNGSGSSDPDSDPLTYKWRIISKPAGSVATLTGSTTINPTITLDVFAATYVFGLTVNDGYIDSSEDTVTVNYIENRPVAVAGPPQSKHSPLLFQLEGSGSYDVDSDPLTYTWRVISRPSGSTSALSSTNIVDPTITADKLGAYVIGLVVFDGLMNSVESTVTLTLTNNNPVAVAGPPQSKHSPLLFQLDGSGSSDGDSDPLTYTWRVISRPSGSTAALSSTNIVDPTITADKLGAYVIGLTVNDGWVNSAENTVTLTLSNATPVANAGPDQGRHTSLNFQLDGSGSSDGDSDTLSYTWRVISLPSGSTAGLSSTNIVNPTITTDRPGAYVIGLIVNDGWVNSAENTVAITYTNAAPVAIPGTYGSVLYTNRNGVQLNGSGSDPDGDPIVGYTWSIESQPSGGTAVLSNANISNPTFNMNVPGTYTFGLVVSDGWASSSKVTTTVTNSSITYTIGWEAAWLDSAGVAWTLDTNNTNSYGPSTANKRTGSYSYRVEAKAAGFPYTNTYSDNRIRRTFSPSAYVISVTLYTLYSNVALCGGPTLYIYKDGGNLATIGSGTGWTTYTRAINAVTSSIGLHTNVCANVSGKSTVFWDDIAITVWN
jgi:hypothetical protein